MVDESEAATVAPVTTSSVKHAVKVKNTVGEDEPNEGNCNTADDPDAEKKLAALSAQTPLLIGAEIVHEAAAGAADVEDASSCALSEEGKKTLADCEKKITKGLATFVEVGFALAVILTNKLFRPLYKSWEEYLDKRWGFTKQRAHQYMQAAQGHHKLSTQIAGPRRLPDSERAMRELLKAPQDKVVDILDQLEGDGDMTAERIIAAREKIVEKKATTKIKKKPAIKTKKALNAVTLWSNYLASCEVNLLTKEEISSLLAAHKTATENFANLKIAA